MRKLYEIVGIGGTFDRLHLGHEHFIKFADQFGQHLHIGITHPKLTQRKKHSELIESYETRKRAVIKFCKQHQISAAVSQLSDVYGPTLEKSKIKALVVTENTIKGADQINQTRQAMDLRQLPVQVCPFLRDETGQIINSERIRSGEISRHGEVYGQIFNDDLILTNQQRKFFAQPQGEIVQQPSLNHKGLVYVVGDNSLESFIKNNWFYDLGIYDQRRQRQKVKSEIIDAIKPIIKTPNPAGVISTNLIIALKTLINSRQQQHFLIEGEEDLAAVALAMLAPLETTIYYGQPHHGLVMMKVTEKLKENIFQVLKK